MKHLFIINPVAGKGKALILLPEIEKIFRHRNDEYAIRVTEKPGHATELVREYVSSGKYRVYSVGGDGTLNEVLNGMAGSTSSLAVIPCGSGNDFIRSIMGTNDFKNILEKTVCGKERAVDIARANDKYFINISSAGFDADVAYNTRGFKKLPFVTGRIAYILGIIATVFGKKGYFVDIEIDEVKLRGKLLLAAVANGRYYGGGMLPAPDARLDDGCFDICLVRDISRIKILSLFPKYIKGHHGNMKEVSFYKGRCITIESDDEIAINIDGEVFKTRKVEFEIIPSGIEVVVPV